MLSMIFLTSTLNGWLLLAKYKTRTAGGTEKQIHIFILSDMFMYIPIRYYIRYYVIYYIFCFFSNSIRR